MKKLDPGRGNTEARMNFVKYWAEYVKTHADEDWSRQQKVLIDSQMQNAKERKEFIKWYAGRVKKTPNKIWSKQQKDLIR